MSDDPRARLLDAGQAGDHWTSLSHVFALARRLKDEPTLMAGLLIAYQEGTGLTEPEIMARLGLNLTSLIRLIFVRRPRSTATPGDLAQVAALVGCPPQTLRELLPAGMALPDHESSPGCETTP